ncbi:hypothetical protein J2Y38_002062 [Flavobacterium sp. 2755]|uniref:hypothetical protein n=1 Tax=Flavobacterium sp. 2755 TaxID=2817765 RepID=UPI00285C7974|nr:hypothetical protein [Flavobacterium sp. 2755]MDR6761853.1 hypothetical protein [Flavobacterium sp. 2755]
MFEIINTLSEKDINKDFVAIGALINKEKSPYHASLIINYKSALFQFHYTSQEIEFQKVNYNYFHKRTQTIHEDEIPAFIAYCNSIKKKANPTYGFFYSGEYYDSNGTHFSQKSTGERMTCVGFCLNVLKGFLEEDYIKYKDWNSSSHEETDYLQKYAEEHNLDVETIAESHRRISPLEILTSGFFDNLPISKNNIDDKSDEVKEYLFNY